MCPLLTLTWICYSASIGLLVRLSIVEAAQKPIFPPRTKKRGHGLKNIGGLTQSPCFLEKFGHLYFDTPEHVAHRLVVSLAHHSTRRNLGHIKMCSASPYWVLDTSQHAPHPWTHQTCSTPPHRVLDTS